MIANEKMTERGLALRQGKEFKTVIKTPTRSKKKDRRPCVAFLHNKDGMWVKACTLNLRATDLDALSDSELKARFRLSEITWNECEWEIYMSEKPMTMTQAINWKPIRAGAPMLHHYAGWG